MKINIAGDFFINDTIKAPLELIENIIPIFEKADFNIINLESPITNADKTNKILKVGPHLNGHPATSNILKMMHVNLVTLANNHIMDYGKKGLEDTLKSLKANQINYVGAGLNLKDASKVITLDKEGFKIGILNFAENEWSIAGEELPGANPLDIIENVKQIKEAKAKHDKLMIIIHGGHEHYHLPSPRMIKQYRFYAENGADIIIGHHTHCISGYEVYNKVPIFYSLSNFLFTLDSKHESWNSGLLLNLEILPGQDIVFELFPIEQQKPTFKIVILKDAEKENMLKKINEYNQIIMDNNLIHQHWVNFSTNSSNEYLSCFSPVNIFSNRYIRYGLRRLNLYNLFLRKQNLKEILNIIRCEAHADISKEIIKRRLINKSK